MKKLCEMKRKDLVIAISDTNDGNMSPNYGKHEEVSDNLSSFFIKKRIPNGQSYKLDILNESKVTFVSNIDVICMETDAIITDKKGLFFYLFFGDCIPFVVFDTEKSVLGFGHLGWQSIYQSLHIKILEEILTKNSKISDLIIILGPSVHRETYAFRNPKQLKLENWNNFIHKKNELYHIDLRGYVLNDIKKLGFNENKTYVSEVNTGNNDLYYSHYRSTTDPNYMEGRFVFCCGMR